MPKLKNANETFWLIFKHYALVIVKFQINFRFLNEKSLKKSKIGYQVWMLTTSLNVAIYCFEPPPLVLKGLRAKTKSWIKNDSSFLTLYLDKTRLLDILNLPIKN